MILDDHDIVNDYPGTASLNTSHRHDRYVESGAKQAYLTYQYLHNPLGFSGESPPFSGVYGGALDFSFKVSPLVRVFALDLRVERDYGTRTILSDQQMHKLVRWLRRTDDEDFDGVSMVGIFFPHIRIG